MSKPALPDLEERLAAGDEALARLKDLRALVGTRCRPHMVAEFLEHTEEAHRILLMHKGAMHQQIEQEMAKERERAAMAVLAPEPHAPPM